MKQKRNSKGQFVKHVYNLPPTVNSWLLKRFCPFCYTLILFCSGTYISEAKDFHANYLKQLYEPYKFEVYPKAPHTPIKQEMSDQERDTGIREENIEETIRRVEAFPEVSKNVELDEIQQKIVDAFPSDSTRALNIAKCESHFDPYRESKVDILLSDGRPFSIGLFQHNLTNSVIGGVDCSHAFDGYNKYAVIVDEQLYNKCVKLAKDIDLNIDLAKKKYSGRGWQPWLWCFTHPYKY